MKKMTKILLVLALSVCSLFTFSTTDVDAATHPYVTFNTPTIYMGEDSELNFTLYNGSNFECLYDFFVYDSNYDLIASKENHIVYGTNAKKDYTLVERKHRKLVYYATIFYKRKTWKLSYSR